MQRNSSIWLHTCVVRHGRSPNPQDKKNYSRRDAVCKSKSMYKLHLSLSLKYFIVFMFHSNEI